LPTTGLFSIVNANQKLILADYTIITTGNPLVMKWIWEESRSGFNP